MKGGGSWGWEQELNLDRVLTMCQGGAVSWAWVSEEAGPVLPP